MIISIVEAIYIVFILKYFKTSYSFNHPLEIYVVGLNNYLKHPINSDKYENKICKLGHKLSFYFAFYIIFRHFIPNNYLSIINPYIIYISIILSLLNLNAFIYLLPIFLFELFFQKLSKKT